MAFDRAAALMRPCTSDASGACRRGESVEADVRGYCDSIDRTRLHEVLRKRVNDGRLWRLIGKWLRAGVMDHGVLTPPETGVV
jgi:hypothetical protein